MYYPYFVAYIAIGLLISLPVFWWALRSGQFQDQQRARFIPLRGAGDGPAPEASRFGRSETIALFFLSLAGLAASAAVLIFALASR